MLDVSYCRAKHLHKLASYQLSAVLLRTFFVAQAPEEGERQRKQLNDRE